MAQIDRHEVNKGIVAAFQADAGLKAIIGDPVRVYLRTPRTAAYPWMRIDPMPARPALRVRPGGAGGRYILRHSIQFTVATAEFSADQAAAVLALVAAIMDAAPANLSIAGGRCSESMRGVEFFHNDPETSHVLGVIEYELHVESTS